jgi:four helix bundle protein
VQNFQNLLVWQKAHALFLDVHRVAGTFPRADGTNLTAQLRRAAASVPANIAEGAGRGSDPEFRRYLQTAMASASETAYHLLSARDLHFIDVETYHDLSSRTAEIRRMSTGLLKRLDARPPRPRRPPGSDVDRA